MIEPRCDKCKETLNDYGAVAFSPPVDGNQTTKYHFCKSCWKLLLEQFLGVGPEADKAWQDGLLVCRWFGAVRDRILDADLKIEGGTGFFDFNDRDAWCECVIKGKRHRSEIPRESIRSDFEAAVQATASGIIADA